jgi:hypothetical protein
MPVVGAVELVRICMAGIIFFSLPAMFFRNDHVCVDLITMSDAWPAWLDHQHCNADCLNLCRLAGGRPGV